MRVVLLLLVVWVSGCQSQTSWEASFLGKGQEALSEAHYQEAEFYFREIIKTGFSLVNEAKQGMSETLILQERKYTLAQARDEAEIEAQKAHHVRRLEKLMISEVRLNNISIQDFIDKCMEWQEKGLSSEDHFKIELRIPADYHKKDLTETDNSFGDEGFSDDDFGTDPKVPDVSSMDENGVPRTTLHVEDISLIHLLKLYTEVVGLEFTVTESVILIVPPKPLEIWKDYIYGKLSPDEWESLKSFTEFYMDTSEYLLDQGKQIKINDDQKLLRLKLHRDNHLWMRRELENYKQVISLSLYTKTSSVHLPYDRAELEKNESDSYKKVVEDEVELLFDRAINWQGIKVQWIRKDDELYLAINPQENIDTVRFQSGIVTIVGLNEENFLVIKMELN